MQQHDLLINYLKVGFRSLRQYRYYSTPSKEIIFQKAKSRSL